MFEQDQKVFPINFNDLDFAIQQIKDKIKVLS